MIRFECPHCGKGLRTDRSQIGQAFNCPGCRGRVRVPERDAGSAHASREDESDSGRTLARFQVRPFSADSALAGRRRRRAAIGAVLGATVGAAAATMFGQSGDLQWIVTGGSAILGGLGGGTIGWFSVGRNACPRCGQRRRQRVLGSILRDRPSACDALQAGDLAALRALSPEGEQIFVSVGICHRCQIAAPIDVQFSTTDPSQGTAIETQQLAHVVYPGAALRAFERLCRSARTD